MDGLTETGDKAKVEAEVEGVVPSEEENEVAEEGKTNRAGTK